MDNTMGSLKASVLFTGISKNDIKTVLDTVPHVTETYESGTIIVAKGQTLHKVGVLLEGVISNKLHHANSKDRNTINKDYRKSDVIGVEVAASGKQTSPFTFTAESKSSVLWIDYNDIIQNNGLPPALHQKITENVLSILTKDNLRLLVRISVLSVYSTRERIMQYPDRAAVTRRGINKGANTNV
jgi:signal-transduction protein with cAMP-binding, CBS, and nucleotidyltransferase domain